MQGPQGSLVEQSFTLGSELLSRREPEARKELGQYLTPPVVARYMARRLQRGKEMQVLDPAVGSGVLACALVERAIRDRTPGLLHIEAFDVDAELCQLAEDVLQRSKQAAAAQGITVRFKVRQEDFVLAQADRAEPSLFAAMNGWEEYDAILSNPPYFKLPKDDERVMRMNGAVAGSTNIYALFMALGSRLLKGGGRACYIVPRSFCSGAYFDQFRRELMRRLVPLHVHVFESRDQTFKEGAVLQENVIVTLEKSKPESKTPAEVGISASVSPAELGENLKVRRVPIRRFLGSSNGHFYFRLPTSDLDDQLIEAVDSWEGSLEAYGLGISTGPIVPFRANGLLRRAVDVDAGEAVPLLWLQNVQPHRVEWPATRRTKPQGFALGPEAERLLVPAANYVLMRRFSAKEEQRRLVVAPFLRDRYAYEWLGLENHLNYIYRKYGELHPDEAKGLAALLGSGAIDRYFRIVNGHTQVNATELRALPLPPMDLIREIGRQVPDEAHEADLPRINSTVFRVLRVAGYLQEDLPTLNETRSMAKIQEAQDVLQALGLPGKQRNELAALTLLVLAQLSEETPWSQARRQSLRIHDMLVEMRERYQREYAENTRETVRRQVIHYFEQAGLVVRNPDEPLLSTNSPRTHYALSDAAIRALRAYHMKQWAEEVQRFLEEQSALIERYQQERERHRIPFILDDGTTYSLSPGPHNELQRKIIEDFGPQFAPGSKVLYVGDAENKTMHIDRDAMMRLNIPITQHDKLPDVMLYDENRNWLYLIEAVTSHGPVSFKRYAELEEMLKACTAGRVYVSAFPDFNTFKSFLADIAWETEVWLSDAPTHMIHFNGDRFMGPRSK